MSDNNDQSKTGKTLVKQIALDSVSSAALLNPTLRKQATQQVATTQASTSNQANSSSSPENKKNGK